MHLRVQILIIAIVALAGAAGAFAIMRYMPSPSEGKLIATISYSCNGGKTITAVYRDGESKPAVTPDHPPVPGGHASVTLSDGRILELPRTISADGLRYANADDSFVFWSKGNGALVLEGGQEKSYIGCIALAPEPSGYSLPQVYTNSGDGFSIRLPSGYTINEKYKYQELGPGKEIYGIRFTIPSTTATGTNLSPDTMVSVEEIPNVRNCTAARFLDPALRTSTSTFTEDTATYSVASSSDAAAGNRYEETVYAFPGSNPCIAVRYFVHYGVIDNYPSGAVREFDRKALLTEFDRIRRSIVIVQ
jgi:membrane-bound inhibitor of C-type lysozyme